MTPTLRVATVADEAALHALMKESAEVLFRRFYDERQSASAVRHVAQIDRMLLEDGTYFVLEADDEPVACGDWTRRGLGRRILEACEAAARREGFTRLALVATLAGVPLYLAYGFEPMGEHDVTMPDGVAIPCVSMEKEIDTETDG
jgi:N-acetylglutamate synthase-like GNAT family acetyltransferase